MKTNLTYGFILALGSALLGMALYFLGFNADVSKLETSRWISMVIGIVIAVVCIYLGMKDKRALTPADKSWGYGSAFGTGFMIGLVGAVLASIFNYVYFAYIDPNLSDLIMQLQIDKMTAKGVTSEQIEQAEPMMRKFMSPIAMTISGFIGAVIFNTVISLIVAAFVKNRPAQDTTVSAA